MMDARRLAEVPLRRPWHVLVPVVACAGLALAVAFAIPKRYTSSTVILVEAQKAPEVLGKEAEELATRRLPTLQQEILSRTRLERILQEINPYPDRMGREPLSRVIDRMREAIRVAVKGDDAFTISFSHRDPRLAMAVANRLASLFIEESNEKREERAEGTDQFFQEELAEARKTLDAQEEKIRRFKEAHLESLPEQLQANLAALQRLEMEQQGAAEDLGASLKRLSAVEGRPLPAAIPSDTAAAGPAAPAKGAAGPAAAAGAADLADLRAQLADLRTRYTDDYPDVRALEDRIARMERSAPAAAAGEPISPRAQAIRTVQEDVQGRRSRQQELARQIASFEARVEATPRTEAELSTLTRDEQKLKEQYLALLNKQMTAHMTRTLEQRWKGQVFRVIDPAHLPDRATFPDRFWFLVGGLALGLGIGFTFAYASEAMDATVKTEKDLEAFAFPVLAVVGHVSGEETALVEEPRPRARRARAAREAERERPAPEAGS